MPKALRIAGLRKSQSTSRTFLFPLAHILAKLKATVVFPSSGTDEVIMITLGFLSRLEWDKANSKPRKDSAKLDNGFSTSSLAADPPIFFLRTTSGIVERTGRWTKFSS